MRDWNMNVIDATEIPEAEPRGDVRYVRLGDFKNIDHIPPGGCGPANQQQGSNETDTDNS